jgi:hypothetical protein
MEPLDLIADSDGWRRMGLVHELAAIADVVRQDVFAEAID